MFLRKSIMCLQPIKATRQSSCYADYDTVSIQCLSYNGVQSMVTSSLLACVLLELLDVGRMCDGVHCQVDNESTEADTEAGQDVSCKEAVREDGVLAPCLALGPWVTVELWHRGGNMCMYVR